MPCDSLDPPNLSARQMLSAILLFIEENILDRKGFNHERRTNLYSWDAATATTTAPMATPSRSLQQDPMDGSGEEGNTNFAIITIILFVTFILIYLWFCYCLCCCGSTAPYSMEDFDTDRGRFPTSLTSGVHTMENSSHFDGMDVHNEVDEEDDDNAENDVENGNGTTLSSAAAMNPVHINSTSNQHHAASSSTEECDNNDPAEHMRAGGTVVGDIDDSSSTSVSSTTPDVTLHNVIPDRLEDDHNDATDDQHYDGNEPTNVLPRKEDNAVTTFAPRNSDTSTTNSVSQSDNHTE